MADSNIDAKAAYEAYASGQKTINTIADENHVEAFVVTEAIEQYIAYSKPATQSEAETVAEQPKSKGKNA